MSNVSEQKKNERQKLKEEIKHEMRHDERKRRLYTCLGCAGAQLLAILIILYLIASMVAKTGFFDVPLVSKRVYKPAEPARVVLPLAGSDTEDIFASVVARIAYDSKTGLMHTEIKESEMTTLIGDAIAQYGDDLPFEVSDAQIAVEDGYLELFMHVVREDGTEVPVMVDIEPSIKGGELQMDMSHVTFGALEVPDAIADTMFASFEKDFAAGLEEGLGEMGSLQNVVMTDGEMVLSIRP